jgi:hypothetical protein
MIITCCLCLNIDNCYKATVKNYFKFFCNKLGCLILLSELKLETFQTISHVLLILNISSLYVLVVFIFCRACHLICIEIYLVVTTATIERKSISSYQSKLYKRVLQSSKQWLNKIHDRWKSLQRHFLLYYIY